MTLNLSLKSSCLDSLIADIADGHHNKSHSAGDQTQGFTHAGQKLNRLGYSLSPVVTYFTFI